MRTPFVIIALLLCAFVPLALREDADGDAPPRPQPEASVAEIARRVEAIRGLRFTQVPEPLTVTAAQAQEEALAVLDRDYPPQQRAADEDTFELLGLLPPGTDLRAVSEDIYGGAVGGYYDPVDGRLRVVTGGGTSNDVVREITLAHELDHALEDQALDFDVGELSASDDPGLAYKALIEGSATVLMFDYLARHFPPDVAFAGVLGSSFGGTGTENLPPFVTAGLTWPYVGGRAFVAALQERDGWTSVDDALRDRPPASTEQVLHPEKYFAREDPVAVEVPRAPAGWKRLDDGVLGEWQTGQWLRSDDAAAGWGGDRYALYGRGDERLLRLRFAFDTPRDLREFRTALPEAAAVGVRGGAVTITLTG